MPIKLIFNALPKGLSADILQSVGDKTLVSSKKKLDKDNFITVSIVTDAEMKRINGKYAGHNTHTDVLSFSYLNDNFPNGKMLGEIFIARGVASAEAKTKKWSLEKEYIFLVNHAVLHILGFDHQNDKDAVKMYRLARPVLAKLGVMWDNKVSR